MIRCAISFSKDTRSHAQTWVLDPRTVLVLAHYPSNIRQNLPSKFYKHPPSHVTTRRLIMFELVGAGYVILCGISVSEDTRSDAQTWALDPPTVAGHVSARAAPKPGCHPGIPGDLGFCSHVRRTCVSLFHECRPSFSTLVRV